MTYHTACGGGQVKKNADFEARQRDIAAFNVKNRWRKRGMTLIPTKFGISFTTKCVLPCRHLCLPNSIKSWLKTLIGGLSSSIW